MRRQLIKNPLTMRMEQFCQFARDERHRLDTLLTFPRRSYGRGDMIVCEGQKLQDVQLVVTGIVSRSKLLGNGSRQIMAFLIPGDLADVEVFVLSAMDHNIEALGPSTIVLIPPDVIEGLLSEGSSITKALRWSSMVDSAILRERIVDHGRRDARQHIAHLIIELLIRYRVIGGAANEFPFPITQVDLADATGYTPVHTNGVLQELRSDGLIDIRRKIMTVLDRNRLREVAQYNSKYLHLYRTEARDLEVWERTGDLVAPSFDILD